jgi:methylated-DNA-[protein]-cysteine S-methyltransferase
MLEFAAARVTDNLVLRVSADESGIRAIEFEGPTLGGGGTSPNALLAEAVRQLCAYFAGDLRQFDLPLDPRGTEFQQRVWRQVAMIPYGETRSYGQIAVAIGSPAAVRAVGAANGANPLPIVIPCHRVIGAGGKLTGYGGGLELKRRLLEMEGALVSRLAF